MMYKNLFYPVLNPINYFIMSMIEEKCLGTPTKCSKATLMSTPPCIQEDNFMDDLGSPITLKYRQSAASTTASPQYDSEVESDESMGSVEIEEGCTSYCSRFYCELGSNCPMIHSK
jgi:hypothetical protein